MHHVDISMMLAWCELEVYEPLGPNQEAVILAKAELAASSQLFLCSAPWAADEAAVWKVLLVNTPWENSCWAFWKLAPVRRYSPWTCIQQEHISLGQGSGGGNRTHWRLCPITRETDNVYSMLKCWWKLREELWPRLVTLDQRSDHRQTEEEEEEEDDGALVLPSSAGPPTVRSRRWRGRPRCT